MDYYNKINRPEFEEALWAFKKKRDLRTKIDVVIRLYILLGILIGISGFFYFLAITFKLTFHQDQLFPLLFSFSGLFLSVASWGLLYFREYFQNQTLKRSLEIQELTDFLWAWGRFETLCKDLVKSKHVNYDRFSLQDILVKIIDLGYINSEDYMVVDEAMRIRNLILHSSATIPEYVTKHLSKQLIQIFERINKEARKK